MIRRHIPALDGVRGVAVLAVLLHNIGYLEEPADTILLKILRVAFDSGWSGVQLFFVLSGFLITGILLDTKRASHYFRDFYMRRTLRIFPLYYFVLACAFFLLPRLVDLGEWGTRADTLQVWYWTYLMNWTDAYLGTLPGLSHFWSLGVEEQFYLLWPVVVMALAPTQLLRVCWLLIVSALIMRIAMLWWQAPVEAIYRFTVTRWDALAMGAVIAIALREPMRHASLMRYVRRLALPSGIVLLIIAVLEHGLGWRSPLMLTVGLSIFALIFGWLVLAAADSRAPASILYRVLCAPALRFVGKYSYGMYVIHYPIHLFAERQFGAWVVADPAAGRPVRLLLYVGGIVTVTMAAAVVLFHGLERPFLAMKRHWGE